MTTQDSVPFVPSGPRVRIAAVVLNYKTAELSLQAAKSAAQDLDPERDVVLIVDNQSPDDSAAVITEGIAKMGLPHVHLVQSAENGGFAAGNNAGIRRAVADAYLLLNSDTIVRPGAMSALLSTLMSSPQIGIVSPRLEFEDGEPQTSCFRYHSLASEFISGAQTGPVTRLLQSWDVSMGVQAEQVEVPWTSFACVLIRKEVFQTVGLLDEGFFMYYEDADFCRVVRAAGFSVVHNPAAKVVHLRGKSSPVKEAGRLRKRRPGYFYAARGRYFRRAYGPWGAAAANALWTLGRLVALPREVIGHKDRHTVEGEFRDKWIDTFDNGPRKP